MYLLKNNPNKLIVALFLLISSFLLGFPIRDANFLLGEINRIKALPYAVVMFNADRYDYYVDDLDTLASITTTGQEERHLMMLMQVEEGCQKSFLYCDMLADNEIVLTEWFAQANQIQIGDTIRQNSINSNDFLVVDVIAFQVDLVNDEGVYRYPVGIIGYDEHTRLSSRIAFETDPNLNGSVQIMIPMSNIQYQLQQELFVQFAIYSSILGVLLIVGTGLAHHVIGYKDFYMSIRKMDGTSQNYRWLLNICLVLPIAFTNILLFLYVPVTSMIVPIILLGAIGLYNLTLLLIFGR